MVRGKLEMAADFANRRDVPHGVRSKCVNGVWRIIKYGPRYENVFRVTEFDEDGLRWLQEHQDSTTGSKKDE